MNIVLLIMKFHLKGYKYKGITLKTGYERCEVT